MAWRWTYDNGGASSDFPSQGEAEAWLGEAWRDLLDEGARNVTLYEDDREVYGPMSLEPA